MQQSGGEQHQAVAHRGDRDHRAELRQRTGMACGDGVVVRQEQLTPGAADMGVEDRGQQRQDVGAAAPPFNLVLVDVPVEVIVDVTPKDLSYNWDVRRLYGLIPTLYLVLGRLRSLSEAAVCRRLPTNEKS